MEVEGGHVVLGSRVEISGAGLLMLGMRSWSWC